MDASLEVARSKTGRELNYEWPKKIGRPRKKVPARPKVKLRKIRLNKYIPHRPTKKQAAFLSLASREALFGGAAGGGKSDAILMAALEYVDVPNYNALILRKTFADLSLPDALIPRSHEWLRGHREVKWSEKRHEWRFPSGAKITFGYMDTELHKYRYQGAQFQFLGFDELTQFWEDDYTYLHSRLRRLTNQDIPLRIRCATNPGGVGHLWVRKRFDIGLNTTGKGAPYIGRNAERPYLPSFVSDNPYLDVEDYTGTLETLDPVTREQLLRGDWGVSADGRFRKSWVRYYSQRGQWWMLGERGKGEPVHGKDCELFMIVDPAASAREGPGDKQVWKGAPSSTVIGVFARTLAHNHLLWLDCRKGRWEIPDVFRNILDVYKEWQPDTVGIEYGGLGIGVISVCEQAGLSVKRISPKSQDKLVRATDACNRMERGKVWLPEDAPWLEDVEAELFTWTGHPHEPDDVVDVLAYAAREVSGRAMDYAEVVGYEEDVYRPSFVGEVQDMSQTDFGTYMNHRGFNSLGGGEV